MNKQEKERLISDLESCERHLRKEIGTAKDLESVRYAIESAIMIQRAVEFVERQEIDLLPARLTNGKIRVVGNIGQFSEKVFGKAGTTVNVYFGIVIDKDGVFWCDKDDLFCSIDQINKYFEKETVYQTKFELVED